MGNLSCSSLQSSVWHRICTSSVWPEGSRLRLFKYWKVRASSLTTASWNVWWAWTGLRRLAQCREQHVVVAPPGLLAVQQGGLVEWRAAIELVELALQHRGAVAAAQVRDDLVAGIFLDQIGQQISRGLCRLQERRE